MKESVCSQTALSEKDVCPVCLHIPGGCFSFKKNVLLVLSSTCYLQMGPEEFLIYLWLGLVSPAFLEAVHLGPELRLRAVGCMGLKRSYCPHDLRPHSYLYNGFPIGPTRDAPQDPSSRQGGSHPPQEPRIGEHLPPA